MEWNLQQILDRFLAWFPNWDVCGECGGLYEKKNMKHCIKCRKFLCSNCHRTHQVNPYYCNFV